MRKEFDDIIHKEAGKSGLVLGLGPSVKVNMELIEDADRSENFKLITCNNMDLLKPDLNYDYWILAQPADEHNPLCLCHDDMTERVRQKGAFFLYTDCLDRTPYDRVDDQLKDIDFIGYDQRHFESEPCGWLHESGEKPACCERIIEGRKTIQEVFRDVCKYKGPENTYGCGDTVGVHMIALAVILGLNPIYVTGIDLDYTDGYFNNKVELKRTDGRPQDRRALGLSSINNDKAMFGRIIRDISTIRKMAKNIGVEIYVLDSGGNISEVLQHKRPDNI